MREATQHWACAHGGERLERGDGRQDVETSPCALLAVIIRICVDVARDFNIQCHTRAT
jgi:hypothetical protein